MALAEDGDKVRFDIRPIIVDARPRSWFKPLLSLVRNPHFCDSDQNSGIIDEIIEINAANTFTMFWGTSGVVPITFRKVFYAVHIREHGHSRQTAQKEITKGQRGLDSHERPANGSSRNAPCSPARFLGTIPIGNCFPLP